LIVFWRLLRYVARCKAGLALAFALALLGALVELARPWPVKIVVDYALVDRPLPASLAPLAAALPGTDSPSGLLAWCVAAAVLCAAAGALFSWWVLQVVVRIAQRLVYDLSCEVFEKLQRLSLAFHTRHHAGDLMQRAGADVFVVHFTVSQVVLPGTVSLLTLAGMFAIMGSLDWTLTLIALGVVPLLALSLALFTRPMNDTTARQYECQGTLMALVGQALSAMRLIQGFARETYVFAKLEERARELGGAYNDATRVSGGYNAVTALITGLAAALLLGVGSARVLAGRLLVGDLLVFLGYLAALYGPVNQLSMSVGYAFAVVARGRRVLAILDAEEEVRDHPGAINLGVARGEIAFQGVGFGYEKSEDGSAGRPVLENISFRAAPGQVTAIVGATGAGKTSLVSLLSRFYDPWEGTIRLDGHDLRNLTLRSLRENVALVLQEPFLFPMSAADNIAFGRPGATREEIIAAARAARAHEFIERLPQGYDTVLSEKGASLSGGQRQCIAIARAVLKDAPILILDEPTSALDARTEAQIFDALSHLMENRTTFIISHRLSTVRRADQIFALEGGRIVECGTHDALLARGEVYAQLYRHQHAAALEAQRA
jgi:ABC-type multidrug transport system fused ATPase/permease subunit